MLSADAPAVAPAGLKGSVIFQMVFMCLWLLDTFDLSSSAYLSPSYSLSLPLSLICHILFNPKILLSFLSDNTWLYTTYVVIHMLMCLWANSLLLPVYVPWMSQINGLYGDCKSVSYLKICLFIMLKAAVQFYPSSYPYYKWSLFKKICLTDTPERTNILISLNSKIMTEIQYIMRFDFFCRITQHSAHGVNRLIVWQSTIWLNHCFCPSCQAMNVHHVESDGWVRKSPAHHL